MSDKICIAPECLKPGKPRYCRMHQTRLDRGGSLFKRKGSDYPYFPLTIVTKTETVTKEPVKYYVTRINGQQVYVHRAAKEHYLGRPLDSNEIVHHIDGNGLYNAEDNLSVMSKNEHRRLHEELANEWF